MPADLSIDRAPAKALPVRMTLVAFATKLLRISCKHRLNGRCPGMQAQTVEAALELFKSFDHQRRQCQCCRQRRTSIVSAVPWSNPLFTFDMLRHGVDLVALGSDFATSSLVA